jgi:hypothetical protein
MAIFQRVNGDSYGVVNTDSQLHQSSTNGSLISTGIQGGLVAYKITNTGLTATELGVGGAVETVLRAVELNASILAYQVDSNGQLSLLVERDGWVDDATMQAVITNLNGGGNIGAASNVQSSATTVSSTGGLKFA